MKPWFRGFKGPTEDIGSERWKTSGIVQQTGSNEVEITELPVRMWTQDFKDKLEDIIKAEKVTSFIKDYAEYNTPTNVHFVIKMDDKYMQGCVDKGLEETFKLSKTIATSNLVAFDGQGRIHKYESVLDIMEEFYHIRLNFYEKRKQNQLDQMQKSLDKLSNQARFVKMIIDGKLVVSKKKKQALVEELKKLGFKQFPKGSDAAKAGEKEKTLEGKADDSEDESESVETRRDASAYDYLLGMAIWSLTEERVAKLLRQIGDKEVEIDELIKLTPKDIWTKDLDDFIGEWHFQLEDAKNRTRKSRAAGRRRSAKLGLDAKGAGKRKRKDDDDDFQVGKKKPAVKSVIDRVKAKQPSALMSYFSKPSEVPPANAGADDDGFMDIDQFPSTKEEDGPPLVAVKKRARPNGTKAKAAPKAPKVEKVESDSEVDNMFAAVQAQAAARKVSDPPARNARAAAKKKSYVLSDTSDSDASNGDDLLGDVSMMVKGIGASSSSGEKPAVTARPLFTQTTARPSSSHGLPRSISKAKSTVVGAVDLDDSDSVDQTDYKSLIPVGSPMRPAARRAGEARDMDDDDDDADSFSMPAPKTKALAKKPSVGQKAKVTKPAPVKKAAVLSPAAKAYAAKQAKLAAAQEGKAAAPAAKKKAAPVPKKAAPKKPVVLSDDDVDMDDDDDLANEILSDEETPPVRNRGRRVVAAAKKYAFSDDDDEDEDEEEEESFADGDSD
jgi:DNA topoisomerase-2